MSEEKKSSKGRSRRNFTIGLVSMVLLLAILNIQMITMQNSFSELSNALTGLAIGETAQPTQPTPTQPPTGQAPPQVDANARDLIGDSPTKGNLDAPVVMIEWSDFRCGFCGRFYEQTLPLIEENYINTGDVLFVYKHFPVVGGETEALATMCAQEQDKFWEFHDLIFDSPTYNQASFSQWANDLGMDVAQFEECLTSRKYENSVMEDAQAGMSVGIQGTPGFLINGVLVSGAQPYENFQRVIDDALRS